MRGGKPIVEWYADGWSADRPHGTASTATALVGGMSLLVVMNDGLIGADEPTGWCSQGCGRMMRFVCGGWSWWWEGVRRVGGF